MPTGGVAEEDTADTDKGDDFVVEAGARFDEGEEEEAEAEVDGDAKLM